MRREGESDARSNMKQPKVKSYSSAVKALKGSVCAAKFSLLQVRVFLSYAQVS